jgi:hypothetical protein
METCSVQPGASVVHACGNDFLVSGGQTSPVLLRRVLGRSGSTELAEVLALPRIVRERVSNDQKRETLPADL